MYPIYSTLPSVSASNAPIIANSIAEASLFPLVNGAPGLSTFPAGTLGEGSSFGAYLFGIFSNKAAAPGNITLRARLGGALVWSSGAQPFPAVLHTDNTFFLDLTLMVRAGSKVMGAGVLQSALGLLMLPATNPADSAPINLGQDNDLDITAQFSVADPGNKIQMLGIQLVY